MKLRCCAPVVRLLPVVMAMSVVACGERPASPALRAAAPVSVSLLSETPNHLMLDVPVGEAWIEPIMLDGRHYTQVDLPGFDGIVVTGAPALPYKTVQIIVPASVGVMVEALPVAADIVMNLPHELAFSTTPEAHTGLLPTQDRAAYQKVIGAEPVVVEDVSYAGAYRVATLSLFPFRYDPASRELLVRSSFKVHVTFERGVHTSFKAPVGAAGFAVAPLIALNGEAYTALTAHTPVVGTDLIIAHVSHQAALARFVAFKRARGRIVQEHYIAGQSTTQIKALISAAYASATPPTSTILVGNINQIPSFRGSGDNSWTDYPYTILDPGSVPDIALGRVPAHNDAELNAFIDKTIAREESMDRNIDDVLLTAGRDVSLGCPANVTRVGEKIRPAGPNINIIKKYRSEGASTNDVIASYNASPNIIVYDGHGDRQGMQEIPLVISNLNRLSNATYPIIFDIACLNANWGAGANTRNFAEKILLQPDAGAAGLLASGGSGYGHDFFQTMGQLMAEGRQNLARGDTVLNEVGHVVLGAKIRHGAQDRSYWNYYGDPAGSVWEAN